MVLPAILIKQVLNHYHDEHGHPGIGKTYQLVNEKYWWPTALADIRQHITTCKTCQLVKVPNRRPLGKQQPIATPPGPFDTWAIDTIVMGSSARETKAKYIQLVIDHHSRYVWAYATPKNTSITIIGILRQIFHAAGKPRVIISDRGTNYTANEFKRYLASEGSRHQLTSPYHPQANGLCEKANHTIVNGIRMALLDQPRLKWSTHLASVVANYNRTPHSGTKHPPRYLQFGITSDGTTPPDKSTLEAARISAAQHSNALKESRRLRHDETHSSSNFKLGDYVLRKTADNHPSLIKTSPANTGPYLVIRVLGPETYRIALLSEDGEAITKVSTSHASQLIQFHPRVETHKAGGVKDASTQCPPVDVACDSHPR